MARTVRLGETGVEIALTGLTHVEALTGHLTIPYASIRAVRPGPYRPPAGTLRLGGTAVPWTDVHEGHFEHDGRWLFLSYEDARRVVVMDLDGFRLGGRLYEAVVVEVEDPTAFAGELERQLTARASAGADGGSPSPGAEQARGARDTQDVAHADDADDEVAWTAIAGGEEVVAADGVVVGRVTHPLGDPSLDLFEGIGFRHGWTGTQHMARPEEIVSITRRRIVLSLPSAQVLNLPPYTEADVRSVAEGSGFFRHRAHWHEDDTWHEPG